MKDNITSQRLQTPNSHTSRSGLRFALEILFFALANIIYWSDQIRGSIAGFSENILPDDVSRAAQTLAWIAGALLIAHFLSVLTGTVIQKRTGRPAPALLLNIVSGGTWLLATAGILSLVYENSITGILTASSVVFAVVGFAVRSMIADFFYGVTMAVERPFEIGDWIETTDGSLKVVGRVVGFSWRATTMITREDIAVTIPNGLLATTQFANYDRPDPIWRTSYDITLGYEVTPFTVERLLLSAVHQVSETSTIERLPEVRISEFVNRGIVWELRFWVPDYPTCSSVTYKVQRAMLRNLYFAGISVPRNKTETFVEPLRKQRAAEDHYVRNWIERIDLFAPIASETRLTLQDAAREHLFMEGDDVVVAHEEGDSLFILNDGCLDVTMADKTGEMHAIAQLRPGDFFGEMSLLTGARRTATVTAQTDTKVFEITRDDLKPILLANPELAEKMGDIMASRNMANQDSLDALEDSMGKHQAGRKQAAALGSIIRSFFGLTPLEKNPSQVH